MNQLQILMLVLFRGIDLNKYAAMKDYVHKYLHVCVFLEFKDVKIQLTSFQFALTFEII